MTGLTWPLVGPILDLHAPLWGGHWIGGPPLPECWGFVLPAFLGFLVSLPYLVSSSLLAAALVAAAGLVLLAFWAATGIYQLNRIGVACLGSAALLACGRLWRWARWRLERRGESVPIACLRREDESWAGFRAAWLGELAARGIEVAPGAVTRSGTSSSGPGLDLRVWENPDARGRITTSQIEQGAYHRAVVTMDGADPVVIDRLGRDERSTPWRRLAAALEGAIGEPAMADFEVRQGRIRLTGIEKLGWGGAETLWTSVGVADLDPNPVCPLEESFEGAHGPLGRVLFAPYLRLRILTGAEAENLARRVEGRVYVSTRLLGRVAAAAFPRLDSRDSRLLDFAAACWRWPARAAATLSARPGSGASIDALSRWIFATALPDLHCLAFLKSATLGAGVEGGPVPARLLDGGLAPEASQLRVFRRDARAVLDAPQAAREEALHAFLVRHGHQGPGERSLHEPRLAENPAAALEWIERTRPGHARAAAARRPSIGAWVSPRVWLAAWLSSRQARLRDGILRASWDLRKMLLAAGAQAVSGGGLGDAADIFFLEEAEIARLRGESPAGLAELARARRDRFGKSAARPYPAFWRPSMSDPPEASGANSRAALEPGQSILGAPASPGRARGTAWLALDARGPSGPPAGAILVVPGAGPEWALHLGQAAGVICERGGVLSHLAIVAREMALPAVVGAPGATGRIATGMEIEIDGGEGVVRRVPLAP